MKRLVLLALLGCGGASAVPLTAAWPTAASDYDSAYSRWTRRGRDYHELLQTIAISVTLQGAEFQAAYVHERARRLGLPAAQEAELAAAAQVAGEEVWEIELLMATAKPEWNDLRKWQKKDSMWRLALVGDDGREVEPLSVREDKRRREDVEAYFGDLEAFYHPYIVKFPKLAADGQPLLGAGAGPKKLTFKVGSSVGKVELDWVAGR